VPRNPTGLAGDPVEIRVPQDSPATLHPPRMRPWMRFGCFALGVFAAALVPHEELVPSQREVWSSRLGGAIRGVTVGPIENALHSLNGYGTAASAATMVQVTELGGNWVSITPFGRIWDLHPSGIDLTFEAPFSENRRAVTRAIEQAHAQGLRVLLVPHLWVEAGGWRGEIEFQTQAEWDRWAEVYRSFVLVWADVARDAEVELFSVGVELRSWVTTKQVQSFFPIIEAVRKVYPGALTYGANWDDADKTPIWSSLDVIGINAFFPLAEREGARLPELYAHSESLVEGLAELSRDWDRGIVFTEVGYTARPDPALRPWEWPEDLGDVPYDPEAQADAYSALLAPMVDQEWFFGFFIWRVYADPFDASQEPEWGFSPLYKPAEGVVRAAFGTRFAADRWTFERTALVSSSRR
jgi:hypothetical protein